MDLLRKKTSVAGIRLPYWEIALMGVVATLILYAIH
jgi:hypothetical protein